MKKNSKIIVFYILSFLCFLGCISKKKYNHVTTHNKILLDSLLVSSNKVDSLLVENDKVRTEFEKFLNNSSTGEEGSLLSSMFTVSNMLFEYDTIVNINDIGKEFIAFSEHIKDSFTKKPINAKLITPYRINSHSRRYLLISEGYSDILKLNPKYESVAYILNTYLKPSSRTVFIQVDLVCLVSSTKYDKKRLLSGNDRIIAYRNTIQNMINTLVEKQNNIYAKN